MTTLNTLPTELLENVLKSVDFQAIQSLRKVCIDIRNYIDDSKLESKLTSVAIDARKDEIAFFLESKSRNIQVKYKKSTTGCAVFIERKHIFLVNQNYMEIARNDLKSILSRQKTLLDGISLNIQDVPVIGEFVENLKSDLEEFKLETKYFECSVADPNEILPLIRHFRSRNIKKISIFNAYRHLLDEKRLIIRDIAVLDIWRRAQFVSIVGFSLSGIMAHFVHFKEAEITMRWINQPQIITLTRAFIRSPGFKHFILHFNYFHNLPNFLDTYGEPFIRGPFHDNEIRGWFFHIPDTETALHVTLNQGNTIIFRVIPTDMIEEHLIFDV